MRELERVRGGGGKGRGERMRSMIGVYTESGWRRRQVWYAGSEILG